MCFKSCAYCCVQTPWCCVTSWWKCASLSFFLCPLTRSVLCRNSEVFELSFSSFLVWVFASFLSLVFNRNFVTKSVLPRTTNILFICGSVLLQLVCCFGLIFYPPRSPQEVWRVWWVASCFWVRDPPKARFFPPAFSETTRGVEKAPELQRASR